MLGLNIHFKGVLWEIIPKLFLYPFLSGALIQCDSLGCGVLPVCALVENRVKPGN